MSIRLRLAMGFGVIILAMVVITAFTLIQMGNITDKVNSIVDDSSKRLLLAHKLKSHILTVELLEKDILLVPSKEEALQLIQKVERESDWVSQHILNLRNSVDQSLVEVIDQLNGNWEQYREIVGRVNQLAIENSYEKASQLSHGMALRAFDKVMLRLNTLEETNLSAEQLFKQDINLLERVRLERSLIQGIEENLFSIQEAEQNLLFARSEENINNYADEIAGYELAIQDHMSQLKANPVPISRDAFGLLNNALQNYARLSGEVRRLMMLNPKRKANELLSQEGDSRLKEVDKFLGVVISQNESMMSKDQVDSQRAHKNTVQLVWLVLGITGVMCLVISYILSKSIVKPLSRLNQVTQAIAAGDTQVRAQIQRMDEVGELASAFNDMASLIQKRVALQSGLNKLSSALRGDQTPEALAGKTLNCLASAIGADVGAFYIRRNETLDLVAMHGLSQADDIAETCSVDEGVLGQVVQDKSIKLLDCSETQHFALSLDVGVSVSQLPFRLLYPVLRDETVVAVIVLGFVKPVSDAVLELLHQANDNIAISLLAANTRDAQAHLLSATQRQAEQLHQQQQRLTQANQYKSDFLANMSHELRSPLNSMLLLTKNLIKNEKSNLDEEQLDALNFIENGGQELLGHINDILDLSKVEAGKLDFYYETIEVVSLCKSMQRLYTPQFEEKGIGFEISVAADAPKKIYSDKKRIIQILRNLIANAIKFTDQGKIILSVHTASNTVDVQSEDLAAQTAICFSVKDTGIGIPKEKFDAIFEAFQQADGSTSRKYGGTGLGLAISKELTKRLSGEMQVRSELGVGSEFILVLPQSVSADWDETTEVPIQTAEGQTAEGQTAEGQTADRAKAEEKAVVAAERNSSPPETGHVLSKSDLSVLAGKRVLLVDDDIRNMFAMSKLLKSYDMTVDKADNGELAVARVQKSIEGPELYDLILMDIMMPVMDGYAAIASIRKIASYAHQPIIALTANAMSGDREKCLSVGASDYLTKPIDESRLLAVMLQRLNDSDAGTVS